MASELIYAVDRIQHRTAVLVDDGGHYVLVPCSRLPRELKESDVLRVPVDDANTPDWGRAEIDEEEGERRRGEAGRVIEELERRDPGGDVKL
jgi:hypothetical protein